MNKVCCKLTLMIIILGFVVLLRLDVITRVSTRVTGSRLVDLLRVFGIPRLLWSAEIIIQRHNWKAEVGSVIRSVLAYVITNVSGGTERFFVGLKTIGIFGTGHSTLTGLTEGLRSTTMTSEVDSSRCLKYGGKD